jgi:aspartate/methionine/tyrosine aminotransferase
MTGWRLGWLVVPDGPGARGRALAQNLFICPSTVGAARRTGLLRARQPGRVTNDRRAEFKARRDYFVPALQSAWAWRCR